MRGSNMRPRAQLSIPTILIALVACAALLGWWNAASSLRQNQAKLDAMLRAHPVLTPSPNLDPDLVRESSCPDWGWKGFSDEEATQCRADRGLASAG